MKRKQTCSAMIPIERDSLFHAMESGWLRGPALSLFLFLRGNAFDRGDLQGHAEASWREMADGSSYGMAQTVSGMGVLREHDWVRPVSVIKRSAGRTWWVIPDMFIWDDFTRLTRSAGRTKRSAGRTTKEPINVPPVEQTVPPVEQHLVMIARNEPESNKIEQESNKKYQAPDKRSQDIPSPPKTRKPTAHQLRAAAVAKHPDVLSIVAYLNERLSPPAPYLATDWSLEIANGLQWFKADGLKLAINNYADTPFYANQGRLKQLLADKQTIQGWINAKPSGGNGNGRTESNRIGSAVHHLDRDILQPGCHREPHLAELNAATDDWAEADPEWGKPAKP